ncbi:hypothetical protein [Methylovirgula sp. HY1]|uniref:hypothetical protein n=1 Tax=Methylovirgula sp. HY1 TaxID=2822761 RepID=UPI0021040616|nr:hypothetical protein [Methylovirgula sp. HY1]
MTLHHQTSKAILVSDDGERERAVWLPKQHVEFVSDPKTKSRAIVIVTLPEWLAVEKGLV